MNWFKKHPEVFGLIFAISISLLIFVYRGRLVELQSYGYVGLFLLNILGSATLFLPTPLFLTAFAAGAIYNPLIVAIVASFGSAIGELTGYAAGLGTQELLEKDVRVQKMQKWMDRYGLWTIFVLAAIPNPLFDMAGLIAGASKIPVYKYLSVVWAGKILKFSVIAFSGAGSVVFLNKYF